MNGFLLIAPTGTGKTTVLKLIPDFATISTDGDSLIDWNRCQGVKDWTGPDREHLDTVLAHMRAMNRCVCWYVGTTAVADALNEKRLDIDEVAIVLIPEVEHRERVEVRNKGGHGWGRACEHRALCESLIANYGIRRFTSLEEAINHVRSKLSQT